MSDERRPNKPRQTLGGLGAPRVPIIEHGSTLPSAGEPPERRDSIGSLDDNDRALLNRVLVTAQTAIKTSQEAVDAERRERIALEGKVVARFGDYDARLQAVADDVAELKGLSGDIRGLRGDISSLNADVRQNLNMDAVRDQKTAALELKVAAIASEEGRDAGKSAGRSRGAIWGALTGTAGPLVLAFLMWLIASVLNAMQGKPPPAFPSLAPSTASTGAGSK
jgi:hypothetical protein